MDNTGKVTTAVAAEMRETLVAMWELMMDECHWHGDGFEFDGQHVDQFEDAVQEHLAHVLLELRSYLDN